jgi:hypothetical protein
VVLVNLLEVLTGHKVARRDRDFKHDLVREIEVPFSLAVRSLLVFSLAPACAWARLTLTCRLPPTLKNLRVALDFIEQNIGLRLVNCSAEGTTIVQFLLFIIFNVYLYLCRTQRS